MNKALIIIDAQEDFTRGALRNEDAIAALPVIHEIERFAEENEFEQIIFTHDVHYDDYLQTQEGFNLPIKHCLAGTPGCDLCPEVEPSDAMTRHPYCVTHICKSTFGYDSWKSFWNRLSEVDSIWLCGFCTDICVSANYHGLKSVYHETPITVISDACAGVTPELHEAALKVMKSCHARIVTWSELKQEQKQGE